MSSMALMKALRSRNPRRVWSAAAQTLAKRSLGRPDLLKNLTASGPVIRPSLSLSAIWNQ